MKTSDWEKSQPALVGSFPLPVFLSYTPTPPPAPAHDLAPSLARGPLPVSLQVSARRGRPRVPSPSGCVWTGGGRDVAPGAPEAGPPVPLAEAGGAGQPVGADGAALAVAARLLAAQRTGRPALPAAQ